MASGADSGGTRQRCLAEVAIGGGLPRSSGQVGLHGRGLQFRDCCCIPHCTAAVALVHSAVKCLNSGPACAVLGNGIPIVWKIIHVPLFEDDCASIHPLCMHLFCVCLFCRHPSCRHLFCMYDSACICSFSVCTDFVGIYSACTNVGCMKCMQLVGSVLCVAHLCVLIWCICHPRASQWWGY